MKNLTEAFDLNPTLIEDITYQSPDLVRRLRDLLQ